MNIVDLIEREIERRRKTDPQRREFFRDKHILQMQPPLTSVQEYEKLITGWGRETLLSIVSGFVRGNRDDAEDIVQRALERGYKNLKDGGPTSVPRKLLKELKAELEASGETLENLDLYQQEVRVNDPSAWMYTILRNTGLNYAGILEKERATLVWISQLMLEPEDPRFERADILVERKESDDELHRNVNELPYPYSHIIRQHFFEDIKLKDIADELGYPHSTVRVYAKRGLQMLKDLYTGERVMKGGRMIKKRQQAS